MLCAVIYVNCQFSQFLRPCELKFDSLDKKHTQSWKILPRSFHVKWRDDIKICTNLQDLFMTVKKTDLGKVSMKD